MFWIFQKYMKTKSVTKDTPILENRKITIANMVNMVLTIFAIMISIFGTYVLLHVGDLVYVIMWGSLYVLFDVMIVFCFYSSSDNIIENLMIHHMEKHWLKIKIGDVLDIMGNNDVSATIAQFRNDELLIAFWICINGRIDHMAVKFRYPEDKSLFMIQSGFSEFY